ncbi:MAG: Gldg family protein, partial [Candidatus Hydrogenedentes bacterium]|nr:Gldg family protein [Candidatus Hydrogenedentota bacterium]
QMRQIMMQMGQQVPPPQDPYDALEQILVFEKYNIERVELTKESPLPAEYDSLVVVNPEQLNDRQRWEIARALRSGKNVLMAVQNYEWNYQINRDRLNVNKTDENPQVNDLLENYGVKVADEVLMDVNHVALTITDPSNPSICLYTSWYRIRPWTRTRRLRTVCRRCSISGARRSESTRNSFKNTAWTRRS